MRLGFSAWELWGLGLVVAAGTLLHFAYQWSGRKRWVGWVSPVNESTLEHLKLLYFPGLLFLLVEYAFVGRDVPGFLLAKTLGLLLGMLAIVSLFYTYSGILGCHLLAADILTFFVGVAVSFCAARGFSGRFAGPLADGAAWLLALLVSWLFVRFTAHPPRLALFQPPPPRD